MFKEFSKFVKKITQTTLIATVRARICLVPRRISHQLLVFRARVRKTKPSAWGTGRVKIVQNPRGRVEVDKKGILRTAIFPWNTVSVALTLSNWLVKTYNNVSYKSKELNHLHESMFKLLYIHISDLLEQNISGRYFCEAIIYFARVFSFHWTVTKSYQQK